MIFTLERISTSQWVMCRPNGEWMTTPRSFDTKVQAIEWANNYVSSWQGASVEVKEDAPEKDRVSS